MELKKISMAFSISTLVSLVYPSLGRENGDNHPLVNLGPEMDAVEAVFPASQDYNFNMLENLPTKYMMYLGTCKDKMESSCKKCTEDAIEKILTRKKTISRECCVKVVKAEKQYYMEIRKVMFLYYQLNRFAFHVSFRTNEVWNRCSNEVESLSSSQY